MRHAIPPVLAAVALALGVQRTASAHCEVPCGIYGDEQRFVAMLENHATIEKAMTQIDDLAGKADAQSRNQLARWVATKEKHATDIQQTIAQYFMTQRIKPADPKYVDKLTKAHAVMIAAMKCKQNVDPGRADQLHASILAFYEAYEGKKPAFDDHGK